MGEKKKLITLYKFCNHMYIPVLYAVPLQESKKKRSITVFYCIKRNREQIDENFFCIRQQSIIPMQDND
jgi:hypothetical protein